MSIPRVLSVRHKSVCESQNLLCETEMKVQMCETVSVDVETMVEVNEGDILMEFSRKIESAEVNGDLPYRSVFLPLVDFATKLMAKIPSKGIGRCSDSQRAEVVRRLQEEADRWNAIMVSAED